MDLATRKKEIIKWLDGVENPEIIDKIDRIKEEKPFDFEKEWERAITGEELKKRTKTFLKKLDWKK
jgi:hypothetical protein